MSFRRIAPTISVPVFSLGLLAVAGCSGEQEPSTTGDGTAGEGAEPSVSQTQSPAAGPADATEPAAGPAGSSEPAAGRAPNVMLIVMDDVGYTDLGAYGSEIETPNIDALAEAGVLLTSFYGTPLCSPTRAMLLTGVNNHRAGLGVMAHEQVPNLQGLPGYEGYLNHRVATVSEILQDAGYHTYMTGKWDLGFAENQSPAARGFDKSFALLPGGAGHFTMLGTFGPGNVPYREDGRMVEALPDDFYSTAFYTDRMIEYIDANIGDGHPFFGYLAFTATHWPVQAPRESVDKYNGVYDRGYDVLHAGRVAGLQERGLVPDDIEAAPYVSGSVAWEELAEGHRRYEARMMQIYAAMVDDIDRYVGKLLDYLRSAGVYDDTLVMLISDNGAEGHDVGGILLDAGAWSRECCDNSYENIGNADSYVWIRQEWARASNAPFNWYKGFGYEGGIRVPAVFRNPDFPEGAVNDSFATVMDIVPTVLDFTGVEHPGTAFQGREVYPMEGASMIPALSGEADTVHPDDYVMVWQINWRKAVRRGDWKIVSQADELFVRHDPRTDPYSWRLFNLVEDPAELNDLSAEHPDVFADLLGHWDAYVEENDIVVPSSLSGF